MPDENEPRLKALQVALAHKQKELDLLTQIDAIRDTSPDATTMLAAIVNYLAAQFEADFCLLYLLDADQIKLKAASEGAEQFSSLLPAITNEMAAKVAQLDTGVICLAQEVLSVDIKDGLQFAAVPVILGTQQRLGALILARSTPSFTKQELRLLDRAEDQVDSAVIQTYVADRQHAAEQIIQQKQKELALIDAIDQLRDTMSETAAMLAAIVNLLADHFQTDFCLLFLRDRETGAAELKAVHSRSQLFGRLEPHLTKTVADKAIALDTSTIWTRQAALPATAPAPETLAFAAVPIIAGDHDHLGALLLARAEPAFSAADIQLLQTVENQIDSAVIQGVAHDKHQQHVKELETIYRVDQLRDQSLPFDDMLNAVLQELLTTIEAEMGFVMLYDRAGQQLEVRAATPQDLFSLAPYYEAINEVVNESMEKATLLHRRNLSPALHSIMCLPLILNEQIIGVLGAVNRVGAGTFTQDDCRLLQAIGSQIDTAIFEMKEERRLRQLLGRSVDPNVMERLLASPDVDILKGERLELTVLYADIRGSTSLAERLEPEILVEFINDYLGQMTEIILAHEGTLDKFVGDEVMALFGAPFPQADHALRAARVGVEMQARQQTIMQQWRDRGVETAPIGVGIATGELIVGEMGSAQRTDYTVIGRVANLGARICSTAVGGQVLISQRTYDLAQDGIVAIAHRNQSFKGVARNVTVYEVTKVR